MSLKLSSSRQYTRSAYLLSPNWPYFHACSPVLTHMLFKTSGREAADSPPYMFVYSSFIWYVYTWHDMGAPPSVNGESPTSWSNWVSVAGTVATSLIVSDSVDMVHPGENVP